MGSKESKKKRAERRRRRQRTMRVGALALLCVLGVALLAGMAMFNRNVKPNRDMQWYVREGAVEVAAPAMGEGFAEAEAQDSEFVLPEEGMRVMATAEPAEAPAEPAETLAEPDEAPQAQAPAEPKEGAAADPGEAGEPAGDDAIPAEAADIEAEAEPEAEVEAEPEPEAEIPSGPVTLTITAAGDCTFSGEVGSKSNRRFLECVGNYGYDYFFKGVRELFESDDLTIVNLEGPLTSSDKPKAHGYVFKADPACAQILTGSSVELCNVANNHALDYGTRGLQDTAQTLDEAGVGYCGYTAAYEKTIKGVRVCALGFTKWDHSDAKIVEAVAAARQNCDLLIVNVHWGWENKYQQCQQQIDTGHAIIDAGADLVIGTHPHVIQGIEKYKDKYIVYSLGNFCFAGNANPKDKTCLIFQQSFGFTPGMGIVQAGLVDEGINIIPATISSVPELNDFQPTIMPAEQGAKLLKVVAEHSKNFNVKQTLWMDGNYLLANGLIKGKGAAAAGDALTANLATAGDAPTAGEADDSEEADAAEAAFGQDDGNVAPAAFEEEPFFPEDEGSVL